MGFRQVQFLVNILEEIQTGTEVLLKMMLLSVLVTFELIHHASKKLLLELRQPKGPPSEAPYSNTYRKAKETHELIFSWLSWQAVLLVGAYVRRRPRRRSHATWRPNNRLPETYSLGLPCTPLILDVHAMIK